MISMKTSAKLLVVVCFAIGCKQGHPANSAQLQNDSAIQMNGEQAFAELLNLIEASVTVSKPVITFEERGKTYGVNQKNRRTFENQIQVSAIMEFTDGTYLMGTPVDRDTCDDHPMLVKGGLSDSCARVAVTPAQLAPYQNSEIDRYVVGSSEQEFSTWTTQSTAAKGILEELNVKTMYDDQVVIFLLENPTGDLGIAAIGYDFDGWSSKVMSIVPGLTLDLALAMDRKNNVTVLIGEAATQILEGSKKLRVGGERHLKPTFDKAVANLNQELQQVAPQ